MSKECTTHHYACECREAKFAALEAKVAEQGLSLACLADGILGEDAADRSDGTLVRVGCQMARENAALRAALDSLRTKIADAAKGDCRKLHEFERIALAMKEAQP